MTGFFTANASCLANMPLLLTWLDARFEISVWTHLRLINASQLATMLLLQVYQDAFNVYNEPIVKSQL